MAFEGHTGQVHSIAFTPDGLQLASGSGWGDTTIRLWDTRTGENFQTLVGNKYNAFSSVYSVVFSPDGLTLASGGQDNKIRLWDTHTGKSLRILNGHRGDVTSLAFSPDGLTLASGSGALETRDTMVRLWDTRTGKSLRTLEGHLGPVTSVAFSPDGLTLASAGREDRIHLWNVITGEHLRTLDGHSGWLTVYCVAFSPDGLILASGSEDVGLSNLCTIRLWDVRTGEHLRTLQGHTSSIHSVVFSHDGLTLASGSNDGTIQLWDLGRATTWGKIKRIALAHETRHRPERVPSAALPTPTGTALLPNYPNPFNPETWIPYQLREAADVRLTIYDVHGRVVRTLAVGFQPAGVYRNRDRAAYWDGRNEHGESVATGVYFCTLAAGDFRASRRMLVSK